MEKLAERLEQIAARIRPCPPPDVHQGMDLCPCGSGGSWPCPTTEAAWLARGLDIATQRRTELDRLPVPADLMADEADDMAYCQWCASYVEPDQVMHPEPGVTMCISCNQRDRHG